ncbi:sporulation histidine kinase inhibitor Sda [Oceanobacillus salinisoli]|nr:sporulation histidine kinase inhibitor Sda [Oceanobacillus salinisoli]
MEFLSNSALIDAYNKAVEIELAEDFVKLITNELDRRNIQPDQSKQAPAK